MQGIGFSTTRIADFIARLSQRTPFAPSGRLKARQPDAYHGIDRLRRCATDQGTESSPFQRIGS
jgi:hypothetical protein